MKEKRNVIDLILESKVKQFINDFLESSKSLYYDTEGKLIHPGEFGTYREKLCIDLLRNVVPSRLDFGTGFIINSDGQISSQCDIVIFDSKNTPLIENNEKQRFFPVESVVGVGEVKSTLDKTQLKTALRKMSQVKVMRNTLEKSHPIIFDASNNTKRKYCPSYNPRDQLFTFLICDSFSFDYSTLVSNLHEMYNDISPSFRHNMLLSVKDAALMYFDKKAICYPYFGEGVLKNCMVKPSPTTEEGNYRAEHAHIFSFLNYVYLGIANTTILYPELSLYIAPGLHSNMTIEK